MKYKTQTVKDRFKDMHAMAKTICLEMDQWLQGKYKIELTLTETVTTLNEDNALNRVSDTHRTRRAWDISIRELPEAILAEFINYFKKKYETQGAIVNNKPTFIVYKPHGSGPHIHCQLSRKYALKLIDYKTDNGE